MPEVLLAPLPDSPPAELLPPLMDAMPVCVLFTNDVARCVLSLPSTSLRDASAADLAAVPVTPLFNSMLLIVPAPPTPTPIPSTPTLPSLLPSIIPPLLPSSCPPTELVAPEDSAVVYLIPFPLIPRIPLLPLTPTPSDPIPVPAPTPPYPSSPDAPLLPIPTLLPTPTCPKLLNPLSVTPVCFCLPFFFDRPFPFLEPVLFPPGPTTPALALPCAAAAAALAATAAAAEEER